MTRDKYLAILGMDNLTTRELEELRETNRSMMEMVEENSAFAARAMGELLYNFGVDGAEMLAEHGDFLGVVRHMDALIEEELERRIDHDE